MQVVGAVICKLVEGVQKVLIVRRGPNQVGAGYWEFPGGKIEANEGPEEALLREIQEELGMLISVQCCIGEKEFSYPNRTICLSLYWAQIESGDMQLTDHDAYEWCVPEEINIEALSEADRPFVELIIQGSK